MLTRVGCHPMPVRSAELLVTMPLRYIGGEVHSEATKKQEIPRSLGLKAHIGPGAPRALGPTLDTMHGLMPEEAVPSSPKVFSPGCPSL